MNSALTTGYGGVVLWVSLAPEAADPLPVVRIRETGAAEAVHR